jgi:nitrate/TMAO reductase-like tetraheme cytochrome c subunit
MRLDEQSPKARQFHQAMLQEGSTCIDCHQGIAHMTPEIAARLEEAQSESAGSKEN